MKKNILIAVALLSMFLLGGVFGIGITSYGYFQGVKHGVFSQDIFMSDDKGSFFIEEMIGNLDVSLKNTIVSTKQPEDTSAIWLIPMTVNARGNSFLIMKHFSNHDGWFDVGSVLLYKQKHFYLDSAYDPAKKTMAIQVINLDKEPTKGQAPYGLYYKVPLKLTEQDELNRFYSFADTIQEIGNLNILMKRTIFVSNKLKNRETLKIFWEDDFLSFLDKHL